MTLTMTLPMTPALNYIGIGPAACELGVDGVMRYELEIIDTADSTKHVRLLLLLFCTCHATWCVCTRECMGGSVGGAGLGVIAAPQTPPRTMLITTETS